MSFEDAADYDFCFGPMATRMLPIPGIDDDTLANLFVDTKSPSKNFYRDLSWDSIANVPLEHVVPDVSDARPFPNHSSSQNHQSTSTSMRDFNAGPAKHQVIPSSMSSPDHSQGLTTPSCLKSKSPTAICKTAYKDMTLSYQGDPQQQITVPSESQDMNTEDHPQSSPKSATPSDGSDSTEDQHTISTEEPPLDEKTALEHYEEERKKRRIEALARFRRKREKRSFTKKVRYECRKQLADSRPRVKGRFVRKNEMALYHKYGALYRDHLHELNSQPDEQRVPTT